MGSWYCHIYSQSVCVLDQTTEFFYKESDFPTINLSEILKKSKSEEMFQFIDVYAGGGYCLMFLFVVVLNNKVRAHFSLEVKF